MTRKVLIAAAMLAALAAGILLRQQLRQDEAPGPVDAAAATAPGVAAAGRMQFTLPDLEGKPRAFSEWEGNARLVNFWATWCAPCRREIPLLKETQEKHGDSGLQVIGIAVDFTEDVVAYAAEADFNYPVLIGQEDAMAVAESSGVEFIGLPFTLVVAPGGELLAAHMGEIHAPQIDMIVAELGRLERGETGLDEARAVLKKL